MLSLPIPFFICPDDGSVYGILRDNQLTNQPFRGFKLSNSKSYSFPDFWDISFHFYIVLPGIETVKYVRNIQSHCFDRAINGHDR